MAKSVAQPESLHTLLARVHERIGGHGISIDTSTINGRPDDFTVRICWVRAYRFKDDGAGKNHRGERSDVREVHAGTVEDALRKILAYEDETDRLMSGLFNGK